MFLTDWLGGRGRRPAASGLRPALETLGDRVVPHASPFRFDTPPWSLAAAGSAAPDTPDVATQLKVVARSEVYAGDELNVTVVAADADGRPVRDYTGTVSLASTDGSAVLPAAYTFTAADHGRHTFAVKLASTGSQTVTATDAATGSVTGSAAVTVDAAPAATHLFVQTQRDAHSGSVTRVLVVALDANNRPVPTYTGTVALTSTGTGDTLPAGYTFTAADRGVHVFEVTPASAGSDTITATDTAAATVTGSATATVAAPQVATRFAVFARPTAGVGSTVTAYVVALDANSHVVTGYAGTVTLTSSDATAGLPAAYTFTAADRGVKAFAVTLNTAGSQTLTATDAAGLTAATSVSVGTTTAGGFHHHGRR